jgi:hypothetical protein
MFDTNSNNPMNQKKYQCALGFFDSLKIQILVHAGVSNVAVLNNADHICISTASGVVLVVLFAAPKNRRIFSRS